MGPLLQEYVFTCVSLHPPGFELNDGVGKHAVLSLAAITDSVVTQIQLTQDA